ncbi:hypothetical protein IMSHALPRED_010844 [Imshaugia aleurites]|uniref:F-box domain-containing protein n=1 Tax=Imshaugia aleurites TaxID=172621 RepID=A0A8H3G4Y9_9LECA|nr:hypothetical protein IMSHALPRED_010844 [Imshaugia aleurites]
MTSLLDLPLELVEQIISVLAEEKPPSVKLLHEEPSASLLRSSYHPLKDLSQACSATRELCFPGLFSAVKVNLDSTGTFLRFSERYNLSCLVDSLVLYFDPSPQVEKFDNWLPMVQVTDSVKPSVMTLAFFPSLFAKILPYELNLTDQWAFDIPYQVLQLKMPRDLALSSKTSQLTVRSQNIFRMRPWTHFTFNQGSSIKGYSTYEYFSKQPPSIFCPENPLDFERSMVDDRSFENLTSIDYIAVFPINHIIGFCRCMVLMTHLECLRFQIAPTPSNDVLDDRAAMGKCQQRDLWQEFESCYRTLGRSLSRYREFFAEEFEFVSLDYVSPSLRELIDRTVGRQLMNWECDPNAGTWTLNNTPSKFHE